MKARKIIIGALAVAAAITAGLVACKKNVSDKSADHSLTAGINAVCGCSSVIKKDSILTGSITSNLHLRDSIRYRLSGLVFVTNGAVLTIDAGTKIVGIKAVGTTPGGGLVVTRGSRINAVGTASCPIVFTSEQAIPASGDWSGVILLGKAQTNAPNAFIEGINNTSYPGIDLQFGSADSIVGGVNVNNDTSGILKFVRIEYAGFALSLNNEINGLTLGGVGRGTTIDFVEVFKANDDAFEWFGGTVNASHLLAIDALDDMFDTDNGYRGSISFALGLSDTTRKDQSQSNGFESDNNATGTTATPITHPVYTNVTIIGVPTAGQASRTDSVAGLATRYGRAAHLRRNAEFSINNSIFFGFNYGLSMDSALGNTVDKYYGRSPFGVASTLTHVYAAGYGTAATPNDSSYATESNGVAATGASFSNSSLFRNTAVAAGNVSGSRTPNPFSLSSPYTRPTTPSAANFIPGITSPARPYGAFPGGTDWTNVGGCSDWTRYK